MRNRFSSLLLSLACVLAGISISISVFAQPMPPAVQWIRRYPAEGQPTIDFADVQRTQGDSLVIAGTYVTPRAIRFWLAKSDSNGLTLWERYFTFVDSVYNDGIPSIAKKSVLTANGDCIIAGKGYDNQRNYSILLARTNSNGELLWWNSYGRDDWSEEVVDLCRAESGFAILSDIIPAGMATEEYFNLVRTDENGTQLWSNNYGFAGAGNNPVRILALEDGGFMMIGSVAMDDTVQHPNNPCIEVIRTDAEGEIVWQKLFEEQREGGISIEQVDMDEFVVCEAIVTEDNDLGGTLDLRLTWINGAGDQDEISDLIPTPCSSQTPRVFSRMADGGFMIAGATPFGDHPNTCIYLLRMDRDGCFLYDTSIDTVHNPYRYGNVIIPEGGFYLFGNGQIQNDSMSGGGAFLMRLGPEPQQSVSETGQQPLTLLLDQAYPNPFNSSTALSYSLPANSNVRMAVYDLLGQEVALLYNGAQAAGAHRVVWNGESAAAGLYFCRLQAGSFEATRKLILVK